MGEHEKTAGELANKALADTVDYNLLELGHALSDEIDKELRICIENHKSIFDEKEWCVVLQLAMDPLIKNLKRRKFYGWLYLPSPRPDQAVFLYNRHLDRITKRLWVLPSSARMAQLASTTIVPKDYELMQAWSIAFFKGNFWEFIRWQHKIDMLSEKEYLATHRDELIKAGCKVPSSRLADAFDFEKIPISKLKNSGNVLSQKNSLNGFRKT